MIGLTCAAIGVEVAHAEAVVPEVSASRRPVAAHDAGAPRLQNVRRVALATVPNRHNRYHNVHYPPLGLLYMAAHLRAAGFEVQVLDAAARGMDCDELCRAVAAAAPDVLGLTCTTHTRLELVEAARALRERLPHLPLLVGGPHVTFCPQETLERTSVDVVVMGEGEQKMLRLARGEPWPDIPGIAYRRGGSIVINGADRAPCDLAAIPPPARDLVDMSLYPGYRTLGRRSTQVLSNRGCPFGCIYCSATFFWGKRTRSLAAERVVAEIESVVRDYGITAFYFYDDAFTTDRRKARAICQLLAERNLGIVWGTSTRVDLVDRHLLSLMARAGCRQLDFGLETLNPNVCAKIGTKATYEQTVEVIEAAWQAGIRILTLYLIIGLPGDDPASLRETFAKCLSTRATLLSTQILRIYPGTELEAIARGNGVLPADFGWYDPHELGMDDFKTVPIYAEQPRQVLLRQYAFLSTYLRLSSALRQRLPGAGVRLLSRIEPALFRALTGLRREFRSDASQRGRAGLPQQPGQGLARNGEQ
jgi:magnesium-protoporphyrin IX monomethyl ester (oxidative) cyclase